MQNNLDSIEESGFVSMGRGVKICLTVGESVDYYDLNWEANKYSMGMVRNCLLARSRKPYGQAHCLFKRLIVVLESWTLGQTGTCRIIKDKQPTDAG